MDKQAMIEAGIHLISESDEGMQTVRLKEAIKKLEEIIYVRENIPF